MMYIEKSVPVKWVHENEGKAREIKPGESLTLSPLYRKQSYTLIIFATLIAMNIFPG